ncbi:MAG: hypothetical protein QM478_11550 [Flavobacteriaceae bacterium]
MKKEKINCYVYQEGDIQLDSKTCEGGILVMSGDEDEIKRLIDKELSIGLFSGVKRPFLHTVNSFTKANLPDKAVDALTEWVGFVAHKYSDKDIVFAT